MSFGALRSLKLRLRNQFVYRRKHTACPLQGQPCHCLGKKSLGVLRIVRNKRSRDSSVIVVTWLRARGRSHRGSTPGSGKGLFLLKWPSHSALRWVPRGGFLGVKAIGDVNMAVPCSVEFKNAWSCTCTLQYVFVSWCSITHSDIFLFIRNVKHINAVCGEFFS